MPPVLAPAAPPPVRPTVWAEPEDAAYARWQADLERRMAQHDQAVRVLAGDLAARTRWRVEATKGGAADAVDRPPDLLCRRGDRVPLCLEVELPETLVRRATLARLRRLSGPRAYDTRVVLLAPAAQHRLRIAEGRRLLARAGLRLGVAAISVEGPTITGADW
jgi:hypothetical protein